MIKVPFFSPGREFKLHEAEYTNAWKDVRKRGDLILRKDVEEFEANFAKYVGTKYAIGLNSGTDALLVALKAIGIGEGDKVLVPSHTFVATAQVVAQLGAIPVMYDLAPDLTRILATGNYQAIMVAHIAGEFSFDMKSLFDELYEYGIPVIEDACQALGAIQDGKKAGSFGKVGAFSFYPAKILGGPGDGGALVTNDEEVYKFALDYRNHWKSDFSKWGINSRLDNVIASELLLKLKRLPKTLKRRAQIAKMYLKGIEGKDILPIDIKGRVWQDFIIKCIDNKQREKLYSWLKHRGVETMRNEYPMPCGKLSNAKNYEERTLRLPINEVLTDKEVNYVIKCVNDFYDAEENQTIF